MSWRAKSDCTGVVQQPQQRIRIPLSYSILKAGRRKLLIAARTMWLAPQTLVCTRLNEGMSLPLARCAALQERVTFPRMYQSDCTFRNWNAGARVETYTWKYFQCPKTEECYVEKTTISDQGYTSYQRIHFTSCKFLTFPVLKCFNTDVLFVFLFFTRNHPSHKTLYLKCDLKGFPTRPIRSLIIQKTDWESMAFFFFKLTRKGNKKLNELKRIYHKTRNSRSAI